MITKQLAEEIVKQTMIRLNRNLNVMDINGMIMASGETERIERIHEGAAFVAKTGEVLWITEDDLSDWHGSKIGVNMPIRFQEKLVGIIGITGNPDELRDIANLVQLTTEMMVHQSLITSRREWLRKLKELIFEELINSNSPSSIVYERLALIQFSGTSPFVTLLIESNNFLPSPQTIIELLEDQFEKRSVLIGHSQLNEIFILLAGMDEHSLKNKLSKLLTLLQKDSSVRIGVGNAVHTLSEIQHSYTTAKSALQFGNSKQPLIYFKEVELLALLKNNPPAITKQFSERVLTGLSEQLLQTLSIYFECNKNNTATTSALQIHRHTLSYRLKKIKEITGLDPSLFQEAVLLNIALLLQDK